MNLNTTVGQTACQLLCRYTQSTLAASCVCWIVDCCVRLYQKNLCCSCLKCTWSVAQLTGGGGANLPPAKLNVKTGPLFSLCFGIIYYSVGFSTVDCCFFACFGVFSGDFVFFNSRSIPDLLLFLNYFLSVSQRVSFS